MASETPSAPAFDEVADELYGMVPDDFTAARTRYERQARKAGDRELATAIHQLTKPAVAAWLINHLVRERGDELAALAELGTGLRQATERLAGDELRQLSRQQHELVYALVQEARQLGSAGGRTVSEATARAVEDTLYAAMADGRAAEQLLAGRLTEPLQRGGFNEWPSAETGAPTRDVSAPGPGNEAGGHEGSRRAEQDLAEAEQVLTEARKARDAAKAQSADADQIAERARDQVEQLRQQLEVATADADEANRRREEQAEALEQAERAVSDAEERRAGAQERRGGG